MSGLLQVIILLTSQTVSEATQVHLCVQIHLFTGLSYTMSAKVRELISDPNLDAI